ncbi:MAG: SDR family oxidoreductase [Saprospiraceae bacterium]|nr:SDR family oxidoreductase [Saprospiraceae bacterium]
MRILITGASSGIGREVALALAADPGYQVLALARHGEPLEALAQEALNRYDRAAISWREFDLTSSDDSILLEAVEALGGIDILLNNAGLLINKPFAQLTGDDWQQQFDVNVFGPVRVIRLLLPWLQQSASAHIVNISSMGGFQGSSKFPGLSAYSASKAALANLTECLAEEFKDRHISVNCLALGAAQTEMLAAAFPGYQAPLSAADMGGFVAWFATHGHRFFNGKILPVSVSTP